MIESLLRWQQHALLLHTANVRYGLTPIGHGEAYQPQDEENKDEFYMP